MRPFPFDLIVLTSNPKNAAVAGLVPCAESGTNTIFLCDSFLFNKAFFIAIIPQSSPCAPALGVIVTATIPVNSFNQDDIKSINFNEADFILTTGLYDDSFETPKDYNDLFNDFIESEKPIVCVNPDEIVYRGVNSIFCAGALGKYYEKLGGKVVYYGKPYVEIYDQAFQDLKNMNNIENKSDILAIGDSIKTDCLGAQNFNLDFVFIMNGIHNYADDNLSLIHI